MREPRPVLVVTQPDDLTADLVIEELNRRCVPVMRFDAADFPHSVTLSARIDTAGLRGILATRSRRADLDAVRSLYYRRPRAFAFAGLDEQDARWATLQARYGFGGVLASLPGCLYVNHPHAIAAYDYPPGTVARVSLPDGPAEGPGWRAPLGDSDEVSVIGVVVAVADNYVTHRSGRRYRDGLVSMWRVATEEEAAPVLDGEAARLELAGLTGRARHLLALYPGDAPADAYAPPEQDVEDLSLVSLPRVPIPLGAARPETTVHVDEEAGVVWTVVHNRADGDDWSLSNWGGSIAYRHPLTEERRQLIEDLRAHIERNT